MSSMGATSETGRDKAKPGTLRLAARGAVHQAGERASESFAGLVQEGARIEARAIRAAGLKIEELVAETSRQWTVLRSALESAAKGTMRKLGVAPGDDIDALVRRIDALRARIEALSRTGRV
jgi:hypothetical protein